MPKRVTLHAGLHKTGSSTIQQYLRDQDEKLRALGIFYPGPREHEAMEARSNHPLMFNAMTKLMTAPSEGMDLPACREVVAGVFKKFHQSEFENLIWSYEAMALTSRAWDTDYLRRILHGVDVRIVFIARYTDDWIESLYREIIRSRGGPRAEVFYALPMPPIAPPPIAPLPVAQKDAGARPPESLLEQGARTAKALRIMREKLPSAEIVVRSFDADREAGSVVSGALAAMGVPVESAFPDADEEAGLKNPTKSDLYSMLLYHLIVARAGVDVISAVHAAGRKRDRKGAKFEPLAGRRFRFLSDEDAIRAHGYYEELREDFPHLPAQPPYVSKPAERYLPREEVVALLDWLRPDISDFIFDKACAGYPADRERP
ncbi:MAG: hypothetical protein H0X27_10875 [Caulobacteraceae bacterium]|nr:hypothetical protein [Caulobacteraceae bacterium]